MNKMQRRLARRLPMPMAFSSSQFPPSPISNAHPVGSRCGDQHWPNLPSARYFTACTVPAFCAMVLASGLQSTDSDTNSSRLTALAQDSHWDPVHAYAPFREAPRPTTGSLQHRQGIGSDYVVRTRQQVCSISKSFIYHEMQLRQSHRPKPSDMAARWNRQPLNLRWEYMQGSHPRSLRDGLGSFHALHIIHPNH